VFRRAIRDENGEKTASTFERCPQKIAAACAGKRGRGSVSSENQRARTAKALSVCPGIANQGENAPSLPAFGAQSAGHLYSTFALRPSQQSGAAIFHA